LANVGTHSALFMTLCIMQLNGVSSDSVSLHVFAPYADIESKGSFGIEEIYRDGINVSAKYLAVKMRYTDGKR